MDSITTQAIIAFVFGVVFVITLLVIAVRFPNPTPFQYNIFRIILSLASAGVAAMIPGFLNVDINSTTGLLIRAGGALAVFVIVYFFNPAKLAIQPHIEPVPPPAPERLPNGEPFPSDQRAAFFRVWMSLLLLEQAGDDLWKKVDNQTLSAFDAKFEDAQKLIKTHALFFSEEDYENLNEILNAGSVYLDGKITLYKYRQMKFANAKERKQFSDMVRENIQQNKRWLTHYKNLLEKVRSSFHNTVVP